jgi:hypothetical protein
MEARKDRDGRGPRNTLEPASPGALRHTAPLRLGSRTQWGTVGAVGFTGGERYYWLRLGNMVSMLPATTVEAAEHP